MFCPECGDDAGNAKFCPECGTQLDGVRDAVQTAKTTGSAGAKKNAARSGGAAATVQAPQARSSSGMNPVYVWIIVAVVAVVGVVAVWAVTQGDDGGSTATTPGATGGTVDTSGSYDELVERANGLYDQGVTQLNSSGIEGAAPLFAQAAAVYAVAWQKNPGDPNVGTDYATSLFYGGNIDGALDQIANVLKVEPEFQPALFNKGMYLAHLGRMLKGDEAKKAKADARVAFEAAIKVDPDSENGKAAKAQLATLDQTDPEQ